MFRTRLLSGIVLVVLAFVSIWCGGPVLAAVLCVMSEIAYRELTKATGVHTDGVKVNGLEAVGHGLIAFYYVLLWNDMYAMAYNKEYYNVTITFFVILSFLVFMFFYVIKFPVYKAGQVMAAFFELIYAPVLLSFLYIIRETFDSGFKLVWLVFLCSWGSDTCAYCVGVLFGKHKMAPKLSPKKSIEGAIGGVVGAALLFGLYIQFVPDLFYPVMDKPDWIESMWFGAVGAVISMIGDLAASAIKRDYGIKDYGTLIPGHGGIMDRFDSVIVAAPIIFLELGLIMERGTMGI